MAEPTGLETAASYGIGQALMALHPELQEVFDLFKINSTGAALEKLYATDWYKKTGSVVKSREKMRLEQFGAYTAAVAAANLAARKRLVTTGIKIDQAVLDKIIADGYAAGLDDNQIDKAVLESGKITGFGGNILGDTTAMTTYADQFGVGNYFTKDYWTQKSKDLFAGSVTTDDIQKEIRDKASSAYPAYAEQIANGTSMEMIGSAYKGAMASILEKDANSFTWQDPRLRAAMQYIGPDGKPAIKPLWQFEKELRSSPEWAYTNNARDTLDSLTLKVGQDWGIV
jgi:hypothetical protein